MQYYLDTGYGAWLYSSCMMKNPMEKSSSRTTSPGIIPDLSILILKRSHFRLQWYQTICTRRFCYLHSLRFKKTAAHFFNLFLCHIPINRILEIFNRIFNRIREYDH